MAKPYKITVRKSGGVLVNKDISSYVESLEKVTYTDAATGEISSASFMLRSEFGEFQTDANNGDTPILDEFDEIQIYFIDEDDKTFSKIYEIDTLLPQKIDSGNMLGLELLGRERNLQLIHMSGFFFAKNAYDMIKIIFQVYEESRGIQQVEIIKLDDALYNKTPKVTINTYDFTTETTCYDALIHVFDLLGASIGAGGFGDFFSMVFDDNPNNKEQLYVKIFSSGSLPANPEFIQHNSSHPIYSTLCTKEAKTGTNILVKGEESTGFLPVSYSQFSGRQEAFTYIQDYIPTENYKQGMYSRKNRVTYQAKKNVPINNPPPNNDYWKIIKEGDFIGDIQYSPFTADKATVWKNCGANPSQQFDPTNLSSPAFADSNLVIREDTLQGKGTWRDWALIRAKDTADIPVQYKYDDVEGFYDGLRVLVDSTLGALGGIFSGNDSHGVSFKDRTAIYENHQWFVYDPLGHGLQNWDQCGIRSEGKLYEYNKGFTGNAPGETRRKQKGTLQWRDISGTAYGNDCFHRPKNIENVSGLERPVFKPGSTTKKYTDKSAIKITFAFTTFTVPFFAILSALISLAVNILNMTATPAFYNYGWWANFAVPFPESTYNGISEKVGELYGGSKNNKVPFIDLYNMTQSSDGKRGFNHPNCTELLELVGLKFNFLYEIKNATNQKLPFKGSIPFRVTIYDNEGNVWIHDFIYPLHGDIFDVELFFSGFSIYRARTPWGLDTLLNNLITPELEIREIFEKRKVKLITIQMQDAYGDLGRYYPLKLQNFIFDTLQSKGEIKMEGTIDSWGFIKQPLARSQTSKIVTRNIEPKFLQQTGISNYYQLESVAQAQLDIEQHRYEAYTIETDGLLTIKPGQSFILKNDLIINESDIPANPNTRKLVARKITYKVSSSDSGGGFLRFLEGVKKIE